MSTPPPSLLLDSLMAAHKVLAEQGITHALIGGLAANLYRAEPRATRDIDLAILATGNELEAVVRAFRDAGWTAEPRWRKHETLRLTAKHHARVDILVAGTPFEESALARAASLTIGDLAMKIVRPEDLAVYKLIAGRGHDYEAVGAMLNTLTDLDEEYIVGWLEQFDMAERWPQAKQEAERLRDE